MSLDPKIKIGTIVCFFPDSPLLYKKSEKLFGRVVDIQYWPWDVDHEESPATIIVQDFPTIGNGLNFVMPHEFRNLKVIEGKGKIPWTIFWKKVFGEWRAFSVKTGKILPKE